MLHLCPLTHKEAKRFIRAYHRHHMPPTGGLFAVGAMDDDGRLVAVAVVGRPVARLNDDGWTVEVTRLCTDGTRNAASFLYAACWRAARAMGWRRMITYILEEEPGTSLRAAGWARVGAAGGGTWNRKGRPRIDKHPTMPKVLFEVGERQPMPKRLAFQERGHPQQERFPFNQVVE